MKTLIVLWSVLLVLTTASFADDAGPVPALSHPQIITLADGTKLTYLGVTHGTRHWPPHYEELGGSTGNWLYTRSNTPVVWLEVEYSPQHWPPFELLVSDVANTGCVNLEKSTASNIKPGVDVQGFRLDAFPRWDQETILRVQRYRGATSKEHFVMTNPAPAPVAAWMPQPLPDTESDGDLTVTLEKLTAGAPVPHNPGREPESPADPAHQCVRLDFDYRQNGQPTTNWYVGPVITSDAAGNQTRGFISHYPTNGLYPAYDRQHPQPYVAPVCDGYFYKPGLWPDEAAWKLRLEFIRQSGFREDELVTLTNLPVKMSSQQEEDDQWSAWDAGKTNFPFRVTPATINGVHFEMLPPLLLTNKWQSSELDISVIMGADPGYKPQGMNLTVVSATDDQGRDLWHFEKPAWAGHYSMSFARVHADVKSMNLTLALHKSRFVEFTARPAKP